MDKRTRYKVCLLNPSLRERNGRVIQARFAGISGALTVTDQPDMLHCPNPHTTTPTSIRYQHASTIHLCPRIHRIHEYKYGRNQPEAAIRWARFWRRQWYAILHMLSQSKDGVRRMCEAPIRSR